MRTILKTLLAPGAWIVGHIREVERRRELEDILTAMEDRMLADIGLRREDVPTFLRTGRLPERQENRAP